MTGKFIAIEGPDASGKGTQQKYLVERLRESGISVTTVDFPQYETSLFGNVVGKMLNGAYGDMRSEVHPVLASIAFAADRWKASELIRTELMKENIVVANRYTLSNMAHQSARLPETERDDFILSDNTSHDNARMKAKNKLFLSGIPRQLAAR